MKDYYEEKAKEFINDTINCDMSFQYAFFEKYLIDSKITIMDLGFGSGRDSLYFLSKGYEVYAIDPSKAFCNNAKELGIYNVFNMKAQDITFENMFDGIWACASLLHVPSNELIDVFTKCSKSLKKNGIMYCSFKYGDFEGERNGRYFTDMTLDNLYQYLESTKLECLDSIITEDVREDKTTKWLNVILKKM